jgi:hypothetical protein
VPQIVSTSRHESNAPTTTRLTHAPNPIRPNTALLTLHPPSPSVASSLPHLAFSTQHLALSFIEPSPSAPLPL